MLVNTWRIFKNGKQEDGDYGGKEYVQCAAKVTTENGKFRSVR